MYRVIIPQKVQKELARVENKYRLKISVALISLEKDPFIGKKLEGEFKGQWSYKAWPYRIVYQIKRKELIILVVRIGQRQSIYK